jgi:hypothetical protein
VLFKAIAKIGFDPKTGLKRGKRTRHGQGSF